MRAMDYHEITIQAPASAKDHIIASLAEKGALGFVESDESITAYFPQESDMVAIMRELEVLAAVLGLAGSGMSYTSSILPGKDWNELWKAGFTRIDVGNNFSVLPPWEENPSDRISLVIDPGMAFGTGHHETTRSCLVLIERHQNRATKDRFLDLGCGTGLLAVAAAKIGYRDVVAVDIDPLATEATLKNAALNRVSGITVREGGIEAVEGAFDCIVANIISGVLIELAAGIAARLKPSSTLILSGILAEQADEVARSMTSAGLRPLERYPDGKWISLVFVR